MDFKSKKLASIESAVSEANELQRHGDHAGAVSALATAMAEAAKLGVSSPWIFWHAAIANDHARNWEAAFEYINRALELDPLAAPCRQSFDIIVKRLRDALCDADRAPNDPSTPRLYEMLVRAGEADVDCHAAMARYALATGDLAKARALDDAATLLFPASAVAWKCKAAVAAHAGDAATADACAIELAALGEAPGPFAIPGIARA